MNSEDSSSPRKKDGFSNDELFNFSENSLSKDDTNNENENDFDLFDEIIIDKEKEKTDQIVKESSKKLKVAELNLKKCQEENESLKKDNITLMKNISSLWKTACTQLRKNNACILKLTRDNESLKFRSGIQRLSKDDFDRAVSRIAAYDKEEFKEFMKQFQDAHFQYNGERSFDEHNKARPLRPKVNIRASVRGARIQANESVDSIRLQKLLRQKSGSVTRHVIKDFERRRPIRSNFARNGNKQNNKHKSSKKIVSGHHSIYAKINNVEENICELKSDDCSKRISGSEGNNEKEIGKVDNHKDKIISLNKNESNDKVGTRGKIDLLNSIEDNCVDVNADKVYSLSTREGHFEIEFGDKFKKAQESILEETNMAEVDNGTKLGDGGLERAIAGEFEKYNRYSSDTNYNIFCGDVKDKRSEMDVNVPNKLEVKPTKSIVDKVAIGSIIEHSESLHEFDCFSKTADAKIKSILNEVITLVVPDQSKDNRITIQYKTGESIICSKLRSVIDANMDSNKEPLNNRFKDFVPEKIIDTVPSTDLRTYKIPKKASNDRAIDVDNSVLLKSESSRTKDLYEEETSVNHYSAAKAGRKSENCSTENLLVKRNGLNGCTHHDRLSPSLNIKERSKSKEKSLNIKERSKSKENEESQTLKSGTETSPRQNRNIYNKENDKYSKKCSSSQRDQNQEKILISQAHRERRLPHRNTDISKSRSCDRKKRPLSISPNRTAVLSDTNKYKRSKKRISSPRKSMTSKENNNRSKIKFHQTLANSRDRTKLPLQSRERSRAFSDRSQGYNRSKVDRFSLRTHSSKSMYLQDKCHPNRKSVRSPTRGLRRDSRRRKEEGSNSRKPSSISREKSYNFFKKERRSHSQNCDTDESHRIKCDKKKSELQNSKSPQGYHQDINIRSSSTEEKRHSHKIRSVSQDKNSDLLEDERKYKSQNRERNDLQKLNNASSTGKSERPSSTGSNVGRRSKSQKFLTNSSSSRQENNDVLKTKLDCIEQDKQTNVPGMPDTTTLGSNTKELRDCWDVKELVKKLRNRRVKSTKYLSVSRQPSKNIYKLRRMRKEGMEDSFFRNCDKIKRSVRNIKLSHSNSQVRCKETDGNNEMNNQIKDTFFSCDHLLKPSHEGYNLSTQIHFHRQDVNKMQETSLTRELIKVSHEEREPGEISSSDEDTDINSERNVVHTKIHGSNQSLNKQLLSSDKFSHDRPMHISSKITEAPPTSNFSDKKLDCFQDDYLNKPKNPGKNSLDYFLCSQSNYSKKNITEKHRHQDGLLEDKKQDKFPTCSNEEQNEAKLDSIMVNNSNSDFLSMPIRLDCFLSKSSSLSSSEIKLVNDNSSSGLVEEFNKMKCAQNNYSFSSSVDRHTLPAMLSKWQSEDKYKRSELESISHLRNISKDVAKDDNIIESNHGTELNYSVPSSYKDKFSFQEEDTIDQILKQNVADSNQLHSDDSETSLLQFLGNNETPEKTQESLMSFTPPPFVKPPSPPSMLGNASQNVVQSCPAHKLEYLKNILGLTQNNKSELNHKIVSSSITDEPQYISTVVPSVDFSQNYCLQLNSPHSQTKVLMQVNTPSPKTLTTSSCSPIEVATPLNMCIDSASSCTPPSANTSIKSSTPIVAFDLNRKSKYPRETLPILVQKIVDERNKSKSSHPCEKSDVCSDQQNIILPYQVSDNNSSLGKENLDVNISNGGKDRSRSNPSSERSVPDSPDREPDRPPIKSDNQVSPSDASENLLAENSKATGLTLSKGSLKKKVPFTTISHIIDKSNSTFYDFGLQNKEESSYISSFNRKVDDIEDSLLGNPELNLTKQNNPNLSKEGSLHSNISSSSSSSSSSCSSSSCSSSSKSCSSNCQCGGCGSDSSSSSCSTCSSKTNSVSHASLNGQAQTFTDCLKAAISPKKRSPSKRLLSNSKDDSNSLKRTESCSNSHERSYQQNLKLAVEKNCRVTTDYNNSDNLRIDDQATCKFALEDSNSKVVKTTTHQGGNTSFLNVLKEDDTFKASAKSSYSVEKEKSVKDDHSLTVGFSQSQSHFDISFSNSCSPTKVIVVRKKKVCLTPSILQRPSAPTTAASKANIGSNKFSSISVISVVHDDDDHILRDVTSQSRNENTDNNKIIVDSNSDGKISDQCRIENTISSSTLQPLQENLCEEKSSLQNTGASHKRTLSSELCQQVVLVKKKAKRRKVVLSKN